MTSAHKGAGQRLILQVMSIKEQIFKGFFERQAYFFSVFSGLFLSLLFPPFHLSFMAPVVLAPLICVVRETSWKNAAKYGFWAGFSHFVTLLWWLGPTIGRYGELPVWASWPAFFLLVCYLASYFALWAAISAWYLDKTSNYNAGTVVQNALVLAAIWTVLEWLRGSLLSGFPWGSLAYSLADYPFLIQTADIWGHYGISFFIVAINVLLSASFHAYKRYRIARESVLPGIIIILIVLSHMFYGFFRMQEISGSKDEKLQAINVFLLQPGIATDVKWEHENQQAIVTHYEALTKEAIMAFESKMEKGSIEAMAPRLIVFPETAAPFYLQDATSLAIRLLNIASDNNAYLITGSPAYMYENDMKRRYTNSAYLVLPSGEVAARYDKQHLVPFGEYLPWGKLTAWIQAQLPFVLDFAPGLSSVPLSGGVVKAGMLICFESIFPELSIKTVQDGADFLAVITNDAWFGPTGAPYQHEDMAVFRAIETRRWLVRAANTGVSSVIDPFGNRQLKTPVYEIAYATHVIYPRHEMSFYVRFGEKWFAGCCLAGVLLLFFLKMLNIDGLVKSHHT